MYPEAPSHITAVSIPIGSNVFFKGSKLTGCIAFKGTGLLPKLLLQEAEIMELLMRNPHPNIIHYHNCLIKRGRIVGLVLDRCPMTLEHRQKSGLRDFNVEVCMSGITLAVKHLHFPKPAHNDLTPMNIMVDEHDTPTIVNLGSCQPLGRTLITASTPGWIEEDYTILARQHDEIALGKI